MGVVVAADRLERRLTHGTFLHPVAHEAALLDVVQNGFHAGLGFVVGQDARAGDVLAVLGRVGDRVVHVGDAAFVDQVNDQLHFVQAFKVSHFRLIARLDQGFKAHADQFHEAATEHGLLAEEVGFALFLEVGFDDAGPATTDGGAVRKPDFQGLTGCIVVHRHEAGHAAALDVFAAHGVAGALGRHHDDVDAFGRFDQAEVDVQAVGKGDRGAFADVVLDVFVPRVRLQFVGHGEHQDVAPGRGLGDAHDGQAFTFGLGGGGGAFAQRNGHVVCATVAQVQGVGVALRAVAEDRDFLVLDQVHVAIAVVVHAHGLSFLRCFVL